MYQLNEEQKELKKLTSEFVKNVVEDGANERNNTNSFSEEIFKQIGEMGYLGVTIPAVYGGCEMDVASTIIINEIAKSDASLAHLVSCCNYTFCTPINLFGTEAQKEKYIKACATGEKMGALACTEATIECHTTVKIDGDKVYLNGTKSFVTGGKYADYAIVMATTSEEGPEMERLTFVIVDLKNTLGVTIGQEQTTMGLNTISLVEINFNNVELTKEDILGPVNGGGKVLLTFGTYMRLGDSAIGLGLAERAYSEALEYVKVRTFMNQPLLYLQTVQHQLAQMKADLEMMRLAVYYAAEKASEGNMAAGLMTTITKLNVTEKANEICDKCLQLFGGYGYVKGNTIERLYRDVRGMTITGGHSEKMKMVISKFL